MDKKPNIISVPVEFQVNGIRKEDYRDKKTGIESTYSIDFVDAKKKVQSEKDWTPITRLCLTLIDMPMPNLEFGKKYKITFEEVK
jgi:hypothetical protein